MREDTNHNGHFDRIVFMDGGEMQKEKLDENHDQFFETRITYAQGTRKQMTKDQNQDGKPDTIIDYNPQGERCKLSTDSNADQVMDTWQYYANSRLVRMEKDESRDGHVDLKVEYADGEKDKLLRDQDGDRHFETVQLYHIENWDLVIEQDQDGNGQPEARLMYDQGLLRQKEIYDQQGNIQFIEYFDDQGALCRSREREGQGLSLTWIYNAQGQAMQAKRDKDLDGTDEVVFFYQNGTLRRVEEDTNGDGKMDVWEYYDQSEALVRKAQDLDFDGEPDLEK
jgi:antitoxin component YwqK of YwqJK toxin-antitoxin module